MQSPTPTPTAARSNENQKQTRNWMNLEIAPLIAQRIDTKIPLPGTGLS